LASQLSSTALAGKAFRSDEESVVISGAVHLPFRISEANGSMLSVGPFVPKG